MGFDQMGAEATDAARQWDAETVRRTPGGESVAAELVDEIVAVARIEWLESRKTTPETLEVKRLVETHYRAILEDAETPLGCRLTVAAFVCGKIEPPSKELVSASVATLAQTWKEGRSTYGATPILTAFAKRAADEEWEEHAKRLGSGWRARRQKQGGYRQSKDSLLLLQIFLESGDAGSTGRLLRDCEGEFGESLDACVTLLRHERIDVVRRMLESTWRTIPHHDTERIARDRMYGNSLASVTRLVYDEEVAARVAALVDATSRPERKLFARALFATLPDPPDSDATDGTAASETQEDRSARMAQLAREVVAEPKLGGAMRARILGILAVEPAAARIAGDALAEVAADLQLAALVLLDDDELNAPQVSVVLAHVENRLRQGDFAPLYTQLDSLLARHDGDNEYELSNGVSSLVEVVRRVVEERLASWSPERAVPLEELLPACRRLLELPDWACDWISGPSLRTCLLAWIVAGRRADLAEWEKSVSEEFRATITRSATSLRRALIRTLARDESLPFEIRTRVLSDVAATPLLRGAVNTRALFATLVKGHVLTEAELVGSGEPLAEAHPRGGWAWRELAALHERAGNVERAIAYYDKGLEAAGAKSNFRRGTWTLAKARILIEHGREAQAKTALEALKVDGLSPEHAAERSSLLTKLDAGEKTAPAAKPESKAD